MRSLPVVTFPPRRGAVKRRECGGCRRGGTTPWLRGGEAVSAVQTLIGEERSSDKYVLYSNINIIS